MWKISRFVVCVYLVLNLYYSGGLAAPPNVVRDNNNNNLPPINTNNDHNINVNSHVRDNVNNNANNNPAPANLPQQHAAGNNNNKNQQQYPEQPVDGHARQPQQGANQQQQNNQQPLQGGGNQNNQHNSNNQQQANGNQNQHRGDNQEKSKQPLHADTVLASHPDCVQDVERLCHNNDLGKDKEENKKIQHNFEVLDCFMSYKGDDAPPSSACQTVIYGYKKQLTEDTRFETAAKEVCKELIQAHNVDSECRGVAKGGYLPCLMEAAAYADEKSEANKNCFAFLTKMQSVIFTDYHLVHEFENDCEDDIKHLKCGRLWDDNANKGEDAEAEENVKHHNQGPVINCLMNDVDQLKEKCKKQILRVSELQAEDFHMDRPLFFACRADRDRFCGNVESGNGRVYKCLMEHQETGDLEEKCVAQLIKREKLIQEDMKADATFFHACKDLLKETDCMPDPEHPDKIVSMSETLTCMMNAEAEAEKELNIPPQCGVEITAFQSNLMNEYKISAEIVSHCGPEITQHCGNGLKKAHEKDGTVHCLMALAMPTQNKDNKPQISEECLASVTSLLDETRPASILGIDGFLVEQCTTQIHKYCEGEKLQLDCLMDQIRKGKIEHDSDCARHLLELEYFISRNYKHDMQFVKACHKTIKSHSLDHHLAKDKEGPASDGLVFAQLYKLTREQLSGNQITGEAISEECVEEVLRCVRERAVSIDLNPELEEACLPQLTSLCPDAQHGEELGCLEEKLKDIEPSKDPENSPGCYELLSEYIEAQDEDYQLDYILMKSCEPSIKKHCEDVLQGIKDGEIDEGAIIECLIEHKYDKDMDKKCFAGIEHHQIVNMQDFKFNAKFRDSCKKDFDTHCKHVKSKAEVVYCLSAVIRNDTLLEDHHRVSKKCRSQLKVEFLALEDTIQMDPKFELACKAELKEHCADVKPSPDADATDLYMTCIRAVDPEDLKKPCAKYVFKVVKLANAVAGASSHIFRQCKSEIKKYCRNHVDDPDKLLNCLDEHYEESSTKCQTALNEEEEEDNEDIRLNPALYVPCRDDIQEFCSKEMNKVHDDDDSLHGAVINCLKMEYVKGSKSGLSVSCANQMHLLVVKVQTRDYKQDYVLTHQCKKEITQCSKGGKAEEKHILECLKEKLFKGELKEDPTCQAEVFRLITENRVDIHTDGELHDACRNDLEQSMCKTVTAGSGRIMSCLLSIYEAGSVKSPRCKELVKKRKELWEHAAKLSPPETLRQVWDDMSASHSRWYFISVICSVIFVILALGVFCGRASKRVAAEIKNR